MAVALHEIDETLDVVGGDRHAGGFLGDAGVAGRAEQLVAERGGGDGPAERVLAAAAADDQNLHAAGTFMLLPRTCGGATLRHGLSGGALVA
jgi:hypothetical protein